MIAGNASDPGKAIREGVPDRSYIAGPATFVEGRNGVDVACEQRPPDRMAEGRLRGIPRFRGAEPALRPTDGSARPWSRRIALVP